MPIHDRTKRIVAGGLLSGFLLLGGCGQQPQNAAPKGAPPEVAIVTVQARPLVMTTELAGRTSANRVAEVRPQVGGIVQKRLFTEGSEVKAGQVLYRIDPAPYQAALDNAKASLGRSEANLQAIRPKAERLKELLAEKAVSQQDYDDAAAALKQTEADIQYNRATVETAQINLGYTSVKAPIAGRIGRSNVTEGALVTAGQPTALATIQQLDPMYVDVPQSTTELLRLQRRLEKGQLDPNGQIRNKVRLLLEDNTQYPWEGTLQFREPTVDQTTGSVILRVVVPNPKGILLPGMFVRAVVEEGVLPQAILVSQQAVSRDLKGNPFAFVVDSAEKAQQKMLTLERAIGSEWLVTAGLAPGDRLIIEGLQKIRPGVPVKTVPFADAEKTAGQEGAKTAPTAPKAN